MQSVGFILKDPGAHSLKSGKEKKPRQLFHRIFFSRKSLKAKHELKEYSLNGENLTFPVCSLFYPISIIVIIKRNRSVLQNERKYTYAALVVELKGASDEFKLKFPELSRVEPSCSISISELELT